MCGRVPSLFARALTCSLFRSSRCEFEQLNRSGNRSNASEPARQRTAEVWLVGNHHSMRTHDTPSLCTWEVIRTTGMCRHFDIAFLVVRRSGLIELLADTYSPNSHRSILPLSNERSRTSTSQGDTSTLIMVSVHLGLFRARRFMEMSDPVDAHWGNFTLITSRGVRVAFLVVQGRDRSRRSLDDWKFCRNPSS